jgi:glc operon protein GlcG
MIKSFLILAILFAPQLIAAQLIGTRKSLTLEGAKKIAEEAKAYAKSISAPHGGPSIAIVDRGGHLLYLERPETTFAGSALVAYEKAKTAMMFEQPSQNLENNTKGGRTPLLSLNYVLLEGGVPIMVDGFIVGAIGISGAASSTQDVEIAQAAAKTKLN